MPRLMIASITFIFLLWLVPLGVFIKPSQEKIACAGQRAICLCSHGKKADTKSSKMGIHNVNSAAAKEAPAAPGHFFNVIQLAVNFPVKLISYPEDTSILYSFLSSKSLEHVPKA